MIVDREWGMLGSSNCDIRSFRLNFELDAAIRGKEISEELYHLFLQELDESAEIFLADVERKSPLIRIAENICGLFSPVL